jgi:lysophospholipase L1-like esterase
MSRMAKPITAGLLFGWLLTACTSAATSSTLKSDAQPAIVYAAIGASETYGTGADDRYRQAWPQVFYNDALPPSAVLYNLGIPGVTAAQAAKDELPSALNVKANLVTVWLNVNDLVQGVPPATYRSELRHILHALRRGGAARVLVANVPDLRQLPAFKACLPNAAAAGPACPMPAGLIPSAQTVVDLINAYNAVIAEAVEDEGATLVDLYIGDAVIAQHPDWISSDGFHPNAAGYVAIARAFEDAYRHSRG